jgi:hypothetical protein
MISMEHQVQGLTKTSPNTHRRLIFVLTLTWLLLIISMATGCSFQTAQPAAPPLPTNTAGIQALVDKWPTDRPYPDDVYAVVAKDDSGGMATRPNALPSFWRKLAEGRIIAPARCAPELSRTVGHLFTARGHLRREIMHP